MFLYIYQLCSNKKDMQISGKFFYTLRTEEMENAADIGDSSNVGPESWVPQASPLELLHVLDGLWQSHPLGLRKKQRHSPGHQTQRHFKGERFHRSHESTANTIYGHGDSSLMRCLHDACVKDTV